MPADDGLDRWIRDLRGHLERGDLAGIGPVDIGDSTGGLPGELTIRIMLADLDHLDDLPPVARGKPRQSLGALPHF